MKLFAISLFAFLFSLSAQSQIWYENIKDPSNFYDVQKTYLKHLEKEKKQDTPLENLEKDDLEKQFRRWEYILEPRVYPSGKLPKAGYLLDEWNKFKSSMISDSDKIAHWYPLENSIGFPDEGFAGRANCITFHPTDTNIIFVGTPSGGLWKTTNGGKNWFPTTDNIPGLGVSELVINPKNTNIMYMATGDRDAAYFISNPYSYGLLKTTNGGESWRNTGLQFALENQSTIQRLLMHPDNPEILIVAVTGETSANKGIWRSTDAGETWKNTLGGAKYDLEFNPADPNIMYTSGYKYISKSTDNGQTWTTINSPVLPSAEITSSKISVTPANPHHVYVQYQNPNTGSTYGLYKSADDGITWSKVNSNAISIQAGYDWVLCVAPFDTNIICWGGQMLVGSENGGVSPFYLSSGHVDHHDIQYRPGSRVLYNCNDGGVYKSYNNGQTWENLNRTFQTFQYYKLAGSEVNKDFILTGAQDNGNQIHYLPYWAQLGSLADGMECQVDYSDSSIYYASFQYGWLRRYGYSEGTFTLPPDAGNSSKYAWVTPYLIHPYDPKILFVGAKEIYKTLDRGNSWYPISSNLTAKDGVGGGMLRTMAISESDPDGTMYAASYVVIYKTTDGGSFWTDVTSNLPTKAGVYTGSAISGLVVHPNNSNIVWASMTGFSKENKLFKTTNGGLSWENISSNLPAVPINNIIFAKNSNEGIYLATDLGVFYKDTTMSSWIPFMNGLPIVPVFDIEINYATGTLRAATFGRGLWESNLYGIPTEVGNEVNLIKNQLIISPNPASDFIYLKNAENININDVQIYNSFGSIQSNILIEKLGAGLRIDIQDMDAGIYVVKINALYLKFVKIRK